MTATGTVCRSCGAELRAGDKFCHGCGSPVAEPDTHAEYKQVTVLFADVVHSMDIAAAVGAERLREIMTELVDRSAAVSCSATAARVDKFTGDGIMAVFGAPVALEDHAVRACLGRRWAFSRRLCSWRRRSSDSDGADLQPAGRPQLGSGHRR